MPISSKPQSSAPAPRGVIEPAGVNARGVVYFAIGLMVTLVICLFVTGGLFRHFRNLAIARDQQSKKSAVVASVMTGRPYFPSPHEQFSPQLDLQYFTEQQERGLNSYGWIDRKAGVVQIPIDRAMDLVLQRGLPSRSGSNTVTSGPSSLDLQQQRPVQSSPPEKEEGSR
jgi:hypothetical protein